MRLAVYPGDTAARAWADASPYRFLAYPIAGTHGSSADETWRGRAPFLRRVGWGLAALYIPRPRAESACLREARAVLTRAMGAADGYDAVVQWRWEHMPWGATCYLDTTVLGRRVAPIHVPAEWLDYYKGWVGAVLDSGALHPGTCCAKSDEPEVAEALRAVYRERRRALRKASLWTVLADSGPPARGQARCQAEVWQSGAGAIQQSYGGVSLAVSPCWAATPDPSFDERPATDPASLEAMLRPGVAAGVTAAIPSGLATDVRALMEACLSSLALANTSAASLFPYGIDDLEMQITERDGAAHAQVRVSAAKTSNRERVE